MYRLFELQRRMLTLWLDLNQKAVLASGISDYLSAQNAVFEAAVHSLSGSEINLEEAVRHDSSADLKAKVIDQHPFADIWHFKSSPNRPLVIFIPPYSGYYTAITSQFMAAILDVADLITIDWKNARDIPPEAGMFDLEAQIRFVADVISKHQNAIAVMSLSQAGVAVLGALCLLSRDSTFASASMSTMLAGSPLGRGQNATPLQLMLQTMGSDLIAERFTTDVPAPNPGKGRLVFPGYLQLIAYSSANPGLYIEAQAGLLSEIVSGQKGFYQRMHKDMHGYIDVPAELYLDMIGHLLNKSVFDNQSYLIDEMPLEPKRLRMLPLVTVEAIGDEMIGRSQTHEAHQIMGKGVGRAAGKIDVAGGHYGLFGGAVFRRELAPVIHQFIHKAARESTA